MPSRLDRWKAWSQLVLRLNQYDGASDSRMKNLVMWSKMVRLDPTMMFSTVPKWCTPSIRVSRRRLPLRRSRDQLFNKRRWSVDGGIDSFKGNADVNVRLVAQNLLTVKMAGQSFGRKQNYGLTVTVSSEEWCSANPLHIFWGKIAKNHSPEDEAILFLPHRGFSLSFSFTGCGHF